MDEAIRRLTLDEEKEKVSEHDIAVKQSSSSSPQLSFKKKKKKKIPKVVVEKPKYDRQKITEEYSDKIQEEYWNETTKKRQRKSHMPISQWHTWGRKNNMMEKSQIIQDLTKETSLDDLNCLYLFTDMMKELGDTFKMTKMPSKVNDVERTERWCIEVQGKLAEDCWTFHGTGRTDGEARQLAARRAITFYVQMAKPLP